MKKVIIFLTVILLFVVTASAESTVKTNGDWEYRILEDGTAEIVEYTGYSETVQIPEFLDGVRVTSIGGYTFGECSSLTSISIPGSITIIGEGSFCGCSSLTSIIIPDSVTTIEEGAFYACSSLTSISIPDSVTAIDKGVFYACSSLRSIAIPDSVTSIGDYAFGECSSLTSITIPNGITTIGEGTFYECSSLTNITIPDSVTFIDNEAFEFCGSLTSITIPDSVTSIGDYAFGACSSLTSITIPDSVTSIGDWAFLKCSGLTSITLPDGLTSIGKYIVFGCSNLNSFTIPESVTTIGDAAFSFCSSLTSITIPESVTAIGDAAFSFCSSLTSITIPDSVTFIGDGAFFSCSSLTSITVSEGSYAEQYCIDNNIVYETCKATGPESSKAVLFSGSCEKHIWAPATCETPETCTICGNTRGAAEGHYWKSDHTFGLEDKKCSKCRKKWIEYGDWRYVLLDADGTAEVTAYMGNDINVVIPESINGIPVTAVGNTWHPFGYWTGITSITLPDSISQIAGNPFIYISDITVSPSNPYLEIVDSTLFDRQNKRLIYYFGNARSYEIPNGTVEIGPGAFAYHLDNITLPNSVTYIGDEAFIGCNITSITLPDSVTYIGRAAFGGTSISRIVIPDSVSEFGGNPFADPDFNQKPVDIIASPNHPYFDIKNGVVFDKQRKRLVSFPIESEVSSYEIPDGVFEIGDSAFYSCTELVNITIPDSVKSIGNNAFYNCYQLSDITIPDGVKSIGNDAFCLTGLSSITIPSSVNFIGNGAFSNPRNATKITIPDGVASIGYATFSECLGLTEITIPYRVMSIGDRAFEKCYNLTNVIIDEGADSIGDYAFMECFSMTSITIPDSVTSIGDGAFYNCNSLTSITIPDSVTSIGDWAFSDCDSLTSITVSEGSYAEQYCIDNDIAYEIAKDTISEASKSEKPESSVRDGLFVFSPESFLERLLKNLRETNPDAFFVINRDSGETAVELYLGQDQEETYFLQFRRRDKSAIDAADFDNSDVWCVSVTGIGPADDLGALLGPDLQRAFIRTGDPSIEDNDMRLVILMKITACLNAIDGDPIEPFGYHMQNEILYEFSHMSFPTGEEYVGIEGILIYASNWLNEG